MKIKDIIKRQTTMIALAVIVVVVATLSVSYAIFFDVSKNANDQVITAGNLSLTISGINALKEIDVTSDETGKTGDHISYTLENKGNLPATYKLYLYASSDSDSNIVDQVKVYAPSTSESASSNGVKLTSLTNDGATLEGDDQNSCTSNNDKLCKLYLLDSGNIGATSNGTQKELYIWISEDGIEDELNGSLNLSLYMVNEVDENAATASS